MGKVSLNDLTSKPGMTGWFDPRLLSKLLLHVIVSGTFGKYADRRLIHAALDQADGKEFLRRADMRGLLKPDQDGAIWIDYVADLGDGFDATYAIAYLLAQEALDVGKYRLPRGQALIMGGDQVYPDASLKDYQGRMLTPYKWAFPDNLAPDAPHPPVLVIPGNHDWYDGLVLFLALFCKRDDLELGSWRSVQRRSYFAIQLTEQWWLWGIDIQLMEDIDQPQADYFEAIAKEMHDGSNIILCTAVPGWLVAEKKEKGSFDAMGYAAGITKKAGKELKVPLILSGDTHHYSRYAYGDIQFITAGGGGAFLHGTHQLKDEIDAKWWLWPGGDRFRLKTEPDGNHGLSNTAACYPTREESRELLLRNLSFYISNPGFALFLGFIYWIGAMLLTVRPEFDVGVIIFTALAAGLAGYTAHQEGWTLKVVVASLSHAVAHFAAIVGLTWFFGIVNTELFGLQNFYPWMVGALFVEMVPTGAVIGGFIFGVYLLLTCRYFDMNHNDAFSAIRLDSYRHFLRIRIKDDAVTIYPVAIDSVPTRDGWHLNPENAPPASVFAPRSKLILRLTEGRPIEIRAGEVKSVQEVAKPKAEDEAVKTE